MTRGQRARRRRIGSAARSGLSISEILVATTVMLMIIGALVILGQSSKTGWLTVESQLTTVSDAQRAINALTEDLRSASQASLACPGGNRLQLQRLDGQTIEYTRTTSGLMRAVNGGGAKLVASRVTGFTVPSCSGSLVRFQVTTQSNFMTPGNNWAIGTQAVDSQVWVQNP